MQTFKTYEELMMHYWGKIVPMAQAAGVNPWECVRSTVSCNLRYTGHPKFFDDPRNNAYTFAIVILEGKPVFVGSVLYANNCTAPLTIKGASTIRGNIFVGEGMNYDVSILSWTQPSKKRTFMLGDKELPCPDKNKGGYQISLISSRHFFSDFHDAQKVANAIDAILTEARDKE